MPIEKRKVTMTNVSATPGEDGSVTITRHEAVDYVPLDLVEQYVNYERTTQVPDPKTGVVGPKWQLVTVGEEHDAGPGGDEGDTHYPAHLTHELAGQTISGSAE